MKLNNKGFSVVEILMLLVLAGLIGGMAWYVWHQKQNNNRTSSQQQKTELQQDQENIETPIVFDANGEIVQQGDEDTVQKLSYTAPVGWQRIEQTENTFMTYYSPDFSGTQFANGHSVTEGGEINVSAYKQDSPMTIREMVDAEATAYFSFEKYTKIDGIEAIEGSCGHFGRATCLATIYEGYYYEIGYRQVDKDAKNSKTPDKKYQELFDQLVKSLRFK